MHLYINVIYSCELYPDLPGPSGERDGIRPSKLGDKVAWGKINTIFTYDFTKSLFSRVIEGPGFAVSVYTSQ